MWVIGYKLENINSKDPQSHFFGVGKWEECKPVSKQCDSSHSIPGIRLHENSGATKHGLWTQGELCTHLILPLTGCATGESGPRGCVSHVSSGHAQTSECCVETAWDRQRAGTAHVKYKSFTDGHLQAVLSPLPPKGLLCVATDLTTRLGIDLPWSSWGQQPWSSDTPECVWMKTETCNVCGWALPSPEISLRFAVRLPSTAIYSCWNQSWRRIQPPCKYFRFLGRKDHWRILI